MQDELRLAFDLGDGRAQVVQHVAREVPKLVVQRLDAGREPVEDVDADKKRQAFGAGGEESDPEVGLDSFMGALGPERMRERDASREAGDARDEEHGPDQDRNAGGMHDPLDGGEFNEAHSRVPLR